MKKVLRLTESELHGLIKESVNNILQELDWRTYANAANKSAKRKGEYDSKSNEHKPYDWMFGIGKKRNEKFKKLSDKENARTTRFANAANDAVKKDLGYKSKNGFTFEPSLNIGSSRDNGKRVYPRSNSYKYDDNDMQTFGNEHFVQNVDDEFGERIDWHPQYDNAVDWFGGNDDRWSKDAIARAKAGMPTPYERGRMNKGNKALKNWYDGKSKYNGGKWSDEE